VTEGASRLKDVRTIKDNHVHNSLNRFECISVTLT